MVQDKRGLPHHFAVGAKRHLVGYQMIPLHISSPEMTPYNIGCGVIVFILATGKTSHNTPQHRPFLQELTTIKKWTDHELEDQMIEYTIHVGLMYNSY